MKCENCKKYEDCKSGCGLTWPCGAYAPKKTSEPWLVDGEQLFEFLSEQLVKEAGTLSKGVNKGLNIARSAVRNPDAVKPIDPETLPIVRQLRKELERVTAERDAAVEQLRVDCKKCAHYKVTWNGCTPDFECPLSDRCLNGDMWEWRGPKKEE